MSGKFFTAELVNKWEKEGIRGLGEFGSYQPWHQISRSDPPSHGRSHLTYCPIFNRMRHQLSDGEQTILSFCLMVPGVIDIREQFKLERYDHFGALSFYDTNYTSHFEQGTVEIAKSLKIKHPSVRGKSGNDNWVMTSDFVLTHSINGKLEILAVAYKFQADLTKRARDKLRIEQKYWELEHGKWLLITEQKFSQFVGDTAKRVLPWVLHPDQVSNEEKQKCSSLRNEIEGKTLSQALNIVEKNLLVTKDKAPLIFWQTIWAGKLHLDLSLLKFPSERLRFLTESDFWDQNPIVAGRSVCL